jgi:hypothetical protein
MDRQFELLPQVSREAPRRNLRDVLEMGAAPNLARCDQAEAVPVSEVRILSQAAIQRADPF